MRGMTDFGFAAASSVVDWCLRSLGVAGTSCVLLTVIYSDSRALEP